MSEMEEMLYFNKLYYKMINYIIVDRIGSKINKERKAQQIINKTKEYSVSARHVVVCKSIIQ